MNPWLLVFSVAEGAEAATEETAPAAAEEAAPAAAEEAAPAAAEEAPAAAEEAAPAAAEEAPAAAEEAAPAAAEEAPAAAEETAPAAAEEAPAAAEEAAPAAAEEAPAAAEEAAPAAAAEGEPGMSEDQAATKVQSLYRGHKARKEVQAMKTSKPEDEAQAPAPAEVSLLTSFANSQALGTARPWIHGASDLLCPQPEPAAEAPAPATIEPRQSVTLEVEVEPEAPPADKGGLLDGLSGSTTTPGGKNKVPVRQYLDDTVVPILRQALRALVKARPEDPYDFLADYIRSNKPKA